jgi:hypothetical protein
MEFELRLSIIASAAAAIGDGEEGQRHPRRSEGEPCRDDFAAAKGSIK